MPSFFEVVTELFIRTLVLVFVAFMVGIAVVSAAAALGLFIRLIRYFAGF